MTQNKAFLMSSHKCVSMSVCGSWRVGYVLQERQAEHAGRRGTCAKAD